ncbi:hypothetical protein ACJX0J_037557 [Zea mays]
MRIKKLQAGTPAPAGIKTDIFRWIRRNFEIIELFRELFKHSVIWIWLSKKRTKKRNKRIWPRLLSIRNKSIFYALQVNNNHGEIKFRYNFFYKTEGAIGDGAVLFWIDYSRFIYHGNISQNECYNINLVFMVFSDLSFIPFMIWLHTVGKMCHTSILFQFLTALAPFVLLDLDLETRMADFGTHITICYCKTTMFTKKAHEKVQSNDMNL